MINSWVNVFRDQYDPQGLYTSKSYPTKLDAMLAIHPHMKERYIDTIDLSVSIPKLTVPNTEIIEPEPVFVISSSPEIMAWAEDLNKKLNKILYTSTIKLYQL